MQQPAHTETPQARQPTVTCRGVAHRSRSGLFKLIADELSQVQNLIVSQLVDTRPAINRLLEHVNIADGKMIRPGLLLLSYHAVSGRTSHQQHISDTPPRLPPLLLGEAKSGGAAGKYDDAVRVAAIMEMIHNATLLHDDVIDEGTKRRGLPTVNLLWGNDSAVLLGDFLLSRVLKMSTDLEPQLQRLIAAAAARTCEGELKQVAQRKNWRLTEAEYIDIIGDKTAALFGCCCRVGALLAGANDTRPRVSRRESGRRDRVEALCSFGHNLGVAFQITDDLLDMVGDETESGKTLGRDVAGNNITLPLIHLLSAIASGEKNALISDLSTQAHHSQRLPKLLQLHGSLDYVRNRAKQFVGNAVASLDCLEDGPAKKALIDTAAFIAGRAG